jgi:hypothetical protein
MSSGHVEVYREWPDPTEASEGFSVKFTLTYDGPLPATTQSKTRAEEKHAIRKEISYQLAQLWTLEPALASRLKHMDRWNTASFENDRIVLSDTRNSGDFPDDDGYLTYAAYTFPLEGFRFVPLVASHNNLWCELDVLMLRDGDPGHVVQRNGDLDNRIKTLFDALRMPHDSQELCGARPDDDQPFFCLLEDDCLITKIAVATHRRLRKRDEPSTWVELRIGVNVIARKVTYYNRDYLTG